MRDKLADDLAKQFGGRADQVKITAYANRLKETHQELKRQVGESVNVRFLLNRFDFEFEQGRLTEKEYDESRKLRTQLEQIDSPTGPSRITDQQLELYKRALGAERMVYDLLTI